MSVDVRRANPTRPELLTRSVIGIAVAFATVTACVATGWSVTARLDRSIADAAYNFSATRSWLVSFLDVFAVMFSTTGYVTLLGLMAAYLLGRREWPMAAWIAISAVIVLVGNGLLKQIFKRDRPSFDPPLHEIGGYAYPSGHAAGAALVTTVVVLCVIVLTGRGWRRRVLVTTAVAIGVMGAVHRVLLGVHWTTDITGGALFGTLVTLVVWLLVAADRSAPQDVPAAATGTGSKKVAVVVNPAKVGDIDGFKYRAIQVAERHGWSEPVFYETTVEDPGHGQTAQALAGGVDLVVAAGGDGTVRAVCEEAARTGVAVGVLPHGTGNLLARNLDIPLNIRDALDVVFTGQDKAIDLATYKSDTDIETSFLVMAGLGMDAAIMIGVNDQLKDKVGWLAYFVAGVKALRFPAMKLQISVDDGEFQKVRARTVVVGNVGYLQGGIPLLPDARIDDGALDVVMIAPKRFIGWLAIVARVISRRRRTNERLDRLTGRKVAIKAEKDVPLQLDGDAVGEGKEVVINVEHGILLVRVPLR